MRKVCTKLLLKLLTGDQKENRTQVCLDIIKPFKTEAELLRRVITGDE